jgi:hypothetical protein
LSINNLCEIEDECLQTEFEATHGGHVDEYSDEEEAYMDEPIADETWPEEYQRKQKEDNERIREFSCILKVQYVASVGSEYQHQKGAKVLLTT